MRSSNDVHSVYRAFGLTICSDFFLPELAESELGDHAADVHFTRGEDIAAGEVDHRLSFGRDAHRFGWADVGEFTVTPGKIRVRPVSGVSDAAVAIPMLGTGIASLLHWRGALVLHGSAVVVNSGAVIFLGDKGAGKSTTVAQMVARGHRLLSDDVVAVTFEKPGASVLPAYPQIKLLPDALASMTIKDAIRLPKPREDFDKARLRLTSSFQLSEIQPSLICVLDRGSRAALTDLTPPQAFSALLRYSYMTRFGDVVLRDAGAVTHMGQSARLTRDARVCSLEVPGTLSRLDEVADLLELSCS